MTVTVWINPNNREQGQWLPSIGQECLFSHAGKTYYGYYTGGSFKTGRGFTTKYFPTNECLWMPLPRADVIVDSLKALSACPIQNNLALDVAR